MNLLGQRHIATVGLQPALQCGLKRVERKLQPFDRGLDRRPFAYLGPARTRLAPLHCHEITRLVKELDAEFYVRWQHAVNAAVNVVHGLRGLPVSINGAGGGSGRALTRFHHVLSGAAPSVERKSPCKTKPQLPRVPPPPTRRAPPMTSWRTPFGHSPWTQSKPAKSGHPGLPMGAADIATVLFTRYLKFDPSDPTWPDRDRFVLSAGHGSMLIYALLHLLGYEEMTIEEIKRFRQLGSMTPGHPENFITPGIETTTGPLGQGLANAVGMAIAERHLAAEFGSEIVDHRTYVLASDGDLMEGISQEAIALAGHLRLNKLIVLFDDNGISIDGPLSLADSVDQVKRFEAAGWAATRVDGHDPDAIAGALDARAAVRRPGLIACRTTIGFGAPTKAGTEKCHGSPLGADEIAGAREKLGWPERRSMFRRTARMWREAGRALANSATAWHARAGRAAADPRAEFERRMRGEVPQDRLAAAVRG